MIQHSAGTGAFARNSSQVVRKEATLLLDKTVHPSFSSNAKQHAAVTGAGDPVSAHQKPLGVTRP